jgi:hypothetical protein
MIRWVVVIFVGLVIFTTLFPNLKKLGIGKLPGDIQLGRAFCLPFASTILISLVAFLLAQVLK